MYGEIASCFGDGPISMMILVMLPSSTGFGSLCCIVGAVLSFGATGGGALGGLGTLGTSCHGTSGGGAFCFGAACPGAT